MGQLRDRMEADLRLAGYSPNTRNIYLLYARLFSKHFMRPPEDLGETEVRAYMLHLIEERHASRQTIAQVRAALNFLYSVTLHRPIVVERIPVMRRTRRLPVILSRGEVTALFDAVTNPKYRSILMTLYGAGLRISEACGLRVEDIDSSRMVIRVVSGKGGRDRYSVLSPKLLDQLRTYWTASRPQPWLFPNHTGVAHLGSEAVRKVLRRAARDSGIRKRVTPHSLRHCFATHLLECGTDIKVIQVLLGHASLRATEIYTHVTLEHIGSVRSPLDLPDTPTARVMG